MKIDTQTYQARRERLMQSLPENSVVVLRTGELATRNNDCEYEFRPHSSFFYLTGFPEPSAYALIHGQGELTLVTLPKDPEREQWDGFRFGSAGAITDFGANDAAALAELDNVAFAALDGAAQVVYLFNDNGLRETIAGWREAIAAKARMGATAPTSYLDLSPVVSEMRLRKDSEEIAIMEAAAQISVEAHKQAMRSVRPGMKEYQLEAELNYVFMTSGARQPAYNNIVASGSNACVLHYIKNDEEIEDGDLILIDAGAELGCYAADITRTFPANGKFSVPQAALYQVVLDAYHAGMKELTVGTPYEACHHAAVQTLTQGLVDHGLLTGDVDLLIESKAYRDFYMHNTGHWLGLDVHDCGAYKIAGESRLLEEGMVLTIEPGLYVSADNESVDEKWRGIGIRIEDDVLIRADGPYVLTHGLAKEIADIEALMAESR
ncbi:M24 family metallopeptidase [Marinomonas sp. M1K-6]|uniref:Xaa-Pro aminopeptidase n=1 Tax=Marinomonas profundi TaxID=2726122 RepID=A0A847R2S7_9GAMM|nr:aminopeptidase P N-terminal domain-containing protein [Marinomonas profundi]NLQ18122.1 M24 family metallopeptidase [Marinomonas profundi]UDV04094.1 aminopeptidase P N-terminal domain-containing protein [Marinomonas profundi]